MDIREQLLKKINKLPEQHLQEILNFISWIQKQDCREIPLKTKTTPDSWEDPLADFVGGVSHGSLAQKIDEELYGS